MICIQLFDFFGGDKISKLATRIFLLCSSVNIETNEKILHEDLQTIGSFTHIYVKNNLKS